MSYIKNFVNTGKMGNLNEETYIRAPLSETVANAFSEWFESNFGTKFPGNISDLTSKSENKYQLPIPDAKWFGKLIKSADVKIDTYSQGNDDETSYGAGLTFTWYYVGALNGRSSDFDTKITWFDNEGNEL